jgi:hypothetical protein
MGRERRWPQGGPGHQQGLAGGIMASLFKPEVPKQDPAVARQQEDEQRRAEAARLAATQEQLGLETRVRSRNRGIRSLVNSFEPTGSGGSLLGSG